MITMSENFDKSIPVLRCLKSFSYIHSVHYSKIMIMRLDYFHNILSKPDHELISRIYQAKKCMAIKGDELIRNEFKIIGEKLD